MADLSSLFTLQFVMFAEMAVGYILCKIHVLEPKNRSVISKLTIDVLLPANIIAAFNIEMTAEVLNSFLQIFLVSCAIQVFCAIFARYAWNKMPPAKKPVLQYATVCSNAGLLGNAVAEGVYGETGLLYGQIYLIPLRVVMWSAGVSYFAERKSGKEVLKTILTHPCIIAVEIGLLRMLLHIPFPAALNSLLSSLGRCSTPMIMVFLGMILAESGFGSMFSKDNLVYCAMRLFLIPVIVLIGCLLFHLEPLVTGLSVILAAMPAGSTTAVIAEQYHADVHFAADVVVLSTLLSIAILPIWVMVLNAVL